MPEFCRQYEYYLKNSARDLTVCLTASFFYSGKLCIDSVPLSVCVFVCVHACVRDREREENFDYFVEQN